MGIAGAQNANSRPLARYNKKALTKGVGAAGAREKKRNFLLVKTYSRRKERRSREEGKKGRREEGKKGRREEGKKGRREEGKKGRSIVSHPRFKSISPWLKNISPSIKKYFIPVKKRFQWPIKGLGGLGVFGRGRQGELRAFSSCTG